MIDASDADNNFSLLMLFLTFDEKPKMVNLTIFSQDDHYKISDPFQLSFLSKLRITKSTCSLTKLLVFILK